MQNNDMNTPDDVSDSFNFQNDIQALRNAFSLPEIYYTDILQHERLAAALTRWPLLAELAQQ